MSCSWTGSSDRFFHFILEKMNIGIVGAGFIGGALARPLTRLGHRITIANSRGPHTLGAVAAQTGAMPGTIEQAVHGQELVIVSIPQKAIPGLPKALFGVLPVEVSVIDTGNYYRHRDGILPEIEAGLPESRWVEKHLGHPVIKVFNTIYWTEIAGLAKPAGASGRVALPVAGDDPEAKRQVLTLVDALGFDGLDAGSIDDSWRQQPGTPIYALYTDLARAREALAAARLDKVTEYRVRATSKPD